MLRLTPCVSRLLLGSCLSLTGLVSAAENVSETEVGEPTPYVRHFGFSAHEDSSPYTAADWRRDGAETGDWAQGFNDGRVHVADGALRVTYPSGGVGPRETGAQIALQLPPQREYFASYRLRVGEGFSWGTTSQGGKLPGLGSGRLCSGGMTCDGTNGFTARLMWRGEGQVVLYLYHMDKPHKWGEDLPLIGADGRQVVFTPGRWHTVTERVRINTGDNHDGEVELWVDGARVLLQDGLRFVTDGSGVDRFYFSTFHGGNTAGWAPTHDSTIDFDDIRIGPSYEAVGGAGGE